MDLGCPPPVGEVVLGPLPRNMIKVELGGVVVGVVDFLLIALLSFSSFALVAKRSSLATCLATTAPKLTEPDLCPLIAENNFEVRRRREVIFGGT